MANCLSLYIAEMLFLFLFTCKVHLSRYELFNILVLQGFLFENFIDTS